MKKILLIAVFALFIVNPTRIIYAHNISAYTPQYTKHQKNICDSKNQEYYRHKNTCHHQLFKQSLWPSYAMQYMNALRRDMTHQNLFYPLDHDTLRYFDKEENTYVVKIYLGFDELVEEQINISVQNQNLWIQVSMRKQRKSKNNAHYFSSNIERYFSLPKDANTDEIIHSYDNKKGLLTIKIAQKNNSGKK